MIRSTVQIVLLLSLFISIGFSNTAVFASSPDPLEQLRPHVENIISILKDDKEPDKIDRIMVVVQQRFDFKEMAKRVLGKNWRKLSSTEREEFVGLFTELLKYAYVSQVTTYSDQQVAFGKQRIKGKRAQVETMVIDGPREIQVSYIMLLRSDQWKVYDIVVEGVSLIRNYLEQFRGILKSSNYSELTRLIKQKTAEYANKGATG